MHYYVNARLVVQVLHYRDVDEIFFFSPCTTHGIKSLFWNFSKFSILFLTHALLSEKISESTHILTSQNYVLILICTFKFTQNLIIYILKLILVETLSLNYDKQLSLPFCFLNKKFIFS